MAQPIVQESDMRKMGGLVVCLGVAVLALVGALSLFPDFAGYLGLEPRNFLGVGEGTNELPVQVADADVQVIARCMAAKQELVPQVRDGKLCLLEAGARFRAIDAQNPHFQRQIFRRTYPGRSDVERYCHVVINTVRVYYLEEPDQAEEVCQRLETELVEMILSGALLQAELEVPDLP
jgi:hypothetical protein